MAGRLDVWCTLTALVVYGRSGAAIDAEGSCTVPDAATGERLPVSPGQNIVFVGDSLLRYQYLDLVFKMEYNSNEHAKLAVRNPLHERTWPGKWPDFYENGSALLNGNEFCDCLRVSDKTRDINENRHYFWRRCNVTVHYMQFFFMGDTMRGHLSYPSFTPERFRTPLRTSEDGRALRKFLWRKSWAAGLDDVVRQLSPTVLVLNTGHHRKQLAAHFDRKKVHSYHQIRNVARAVSPCVVWKTTTAALNDPVARLNGNAAPAFAEGSVLDMARLTEYLIPIEQSSREMYYWDNLHFRPSAPPYNEMNAVLLRGLYAPDSTPSQWAARFGPVGPYLRVAITRDRNCLQVAGS